MKEQYRFFGPWPPKIQEIVDEETFTSILYIMSIIPPEKMTHFQEREVVKKDKDFILKIMKMDCRDRPTAKELLQDEWFRE